MHAGQLWFLGNLGRDPKLTYDRNGTPYCDFSAASNHTYYKKGEKVEKVTWYRVLAVGSLAKICKEMGRKGRAVFVSGRLDPGKDGAPNIWYDNAGKPHADYSVYAETVLFL